ncbi:MAG: hypothetical protein AB1414_20325, partial [bacterium]
ANNNLISCDDAGDKIRVHSGISATITSSFASPASDPSGLYYDGTDLWSCDKGTSKIYHHSGISATITESFDSPGIAPTGLSCDNAKNLISGNYERYGRFISSVKTDSAVDKTELQFHKYQDEIYFIYVEVISGVPQIRVSKMNTDDTAFAIIHTQTSAYYKKSPQIIVYNNKVHCTWAEDTGSPPTGNYVLHGVVGNLDGSSFVNTQLTFAGSFDYVETPQFQIYKEKKYYLWITQQSTYKQVAFGWANLDNTDFNCCQLTNSSIDKTKAQFQIYNDKVYYIWIENNHIYTGVSYLDGTGFVATQRTTTTATRDNPQLYIKDNKIHYVWQEDTNKIGRAKINIDGTEWMTITDTDTSYTNLSNPQLLVEDVIYHIWQYYDTSTTKWNLKVKTINIDWTPTSSTETSIYRILDLNDKPYPQFQIDTTENIIYYAFQQKKETAYYQVARAKTNLGTIFVHKQKSSLIDRSYITSDNIDDIYYDGTNLISCDKTAKKITIYDGISNTIKNSFTISHEPSGLAFASIVKTSSLQVDKCDFTTLNDTLVISTGKKWLLRWTGSGNLISNVPTTSFQQ